MCTQSHKYWYAYFLEEQICTHTYYAYNILLPSTPVPGYLVERIISISIFLFFVVARGILALLSIATFPVVTLQLP